MLYDLTYMWNLKKTELIEAELVARGRRGGKMGRWWSEGANSQKMDKFWESSRQRDDDS